MNTCWSRFLQVFILQNENFTGYEGQRGRLKRSKNRERGGGGRRERKKKTEGRGKKMTGERTKGRIIEGRLYFD